MRFWHKSAEAAVEVEHRVSEYRILQGDAHAESLFKCHEAAKNMSGREHGAVQRMSSLKHYEHEATMCYNRQAMTSALQPCCST